MENNNFCVYDIDGLQQYPTSIFGSLCYITIEHVTSLRYSTIPSCMKIRNFKKILIVACSLTFQVSHTFYHSYFTVQNISREFYNSRNMLVSHFSAIVHRFFFCLMFKITVSTNMKFKDVILIFFTPYKKKRLKCSVFLP